MTFMPASVSSCERCGNLPLVLSSLISIVNFEVVLAVLAWMLAVLVYLLGESSTCDAVLIPI